MCDPFKEELVRLQKKRHRDAFLEHGSGRYINTKMLEIFEETMKKQAGKGAGACIWKWTPSKQVYCAPALCVHVSNMTSAEIVFESLEKEQLCLFLSDCTLRDLSVSIKIDDDTDNLEACVYWNEGELRKKPILDLEGHADYETQGRLCGKKLKY